jgi:hypothetical protein
MKWQIRDAGTGSNRSRVDMDGQYKYSADRQEGL